MGGALVGGIAGAALSKAFQHDGHEYYVDKQYYKENPNQFMCSMPLENLINLTSTNAAITTTVASVSNDSTTTISPNQVIAKLQQVFFFFNFIFKLNILFLDSITKWRYSKTNSLEL